MPAGVREGITRKGSEKGKSGREGERGAFPCLPLANLAKLRKEGPHTNVLIFCLKNGYSSLLPLTHYNIRRKASEKHHRKLYSDFFEAT